MAPPGGWWLALRTQLAGSAILRRELGLGGLLRLLPALLRAPDPFVGLEPPESEAEVLSRRQIGPAIQLYRALETRYGEARALELTRKLVVRGTLMFLGKVLPRFDRAAYQELGDAIIVNPYDVEGTAEKIYQAIAMPPEEKQARMRRMREVVRRNDIYWWLERFLRDLAKYR